LCLVLAGCPEKPALDAGVADSGAIVLVDAGPPAPAEVVDAGPPQLDVELPDEMDPVQQLDVRIPLIIKDYRLRVFDDADKVVPSDDTAHEADGGIDYSIAFTEPLKAGRKYRLTIEPQLNDGEFKELDRTFKIRGEIEKPPKKSKSKRK
jgi:hypothetical protein